MKKWVCQVCGYIYEGVRNMAMYSTSANLPPSQA